MIHFCFVLKKEKGFGFSSLIFFFKDEVGW